MDKVPYEIERKFLIKYPGRDFISSVSDNTEIVQTYLSSNAEGLSERVRKRGRAGDWHYTHTCKRRINDMRRIELENEVSESEYMELLKKADPGRRTINKTRLCYYYKCQMFEIDIYPFWTDRAVMEIELEDENQAVEFPPEIEIIKEISSDGRYTNASLAMEIPQDII